MKDKTVKNVLRIEDNGRKIKTYPNCSIKYVKIFLSVTVFVQLYVILLQDVCFSFDNGGLFQDIFLNERLKD